MSEIPLKVEVKKKGDVAIIYVAANFYTSTTMARKLKTALKELFDEGVKYFIINMREVESIDSEGLGALSQGYKQCIGLGGNLVICELLNRDVVDVVEIVNLDKIIPFYETEKEAFDNLKL